jgi:hypothetical protein
MKKLLQVRLMLKYNLWLVIISTLFMEGCGPGDKSLVTNMDNFNSSRNNALHILQTNGKIMSKDVSIIKSSSAKAIMQSVKYDDAAASVNAASSSAASGSYLVYKNPLAGIPASSYTGLILQNMPSCINIATVGGLSFSNPTAKISMVTSQNIVDQLSKFSNSVSFGAPSLAAGSVGSAVSGAASKAGLSSSVAGGIGELAKNGAKNVLPGALSEDNSYLKEDLYNKNSLSYYYLYEYKAPISVNYNRSQLLTNYAQQLYDKGVNQQFAFKSLCGDSFVSQMDGGVMFIVRMSVNFSNSNNLTDVSNSLNLSAKGVSLGSVIDSLHNMNNQNFNISLKVYQYGGDPSQISKTFAKNGPSNAGESTDCSKGPCVSSPQPTLACTAANLSPCYELINASLVYSSTIPNQMRDANGNLKTEALYYYNPTIMTYVKAGLGNIANYVPDNSAAAVAQKQLTAMYNTYLKIYYSVPSYLSSLTIPALNLNMQNLANRISYIEATSPPCYDPATSSTCPQVYQTLVNDLNNPENTGFELDFNLLNFYFTYYVVSNYLNLANLFPISNPDRTYIATDTDPNTITFIPYLYDKDKPVYVNLNSFCGESVTNLKTCTPYKNKVIFSTNETGKIVVIKPKFNSSLNVSEYCVLSDLDEMTFSCSGSGLNQTWKDLVIFYSY